MATLTIVGAGMMGSALCVPLAERGHEVRLVGTPLDREIIDALHAGRPHPKMNVALPRAVRTFHTEQMEEALRKNRDALEQRVVERATALERANEDLRRQIFECEMAEEAIEVARELGGEAE